jgi:hypothetical protein
MTGKETAIFSLQCLNIQTSSRLFEKNRSDIQKTVRHLSCQYSLKHLYLIVLRSKRFPVVFNQKEKKKEGKSGLKSLLITSY